jgi:hypothetical protein
MTLISVIRATYPHKWTAVFDDGKRVNFGHANYQDFTQHKSIVRRELYKKRHAKDLETGDPRRPGFLSYYLLWGDSSDLNTNIAEYKRKFNL